MYDNYPPGAANDPNAPYNQPADPDPVDVDVCASYSLSKSFNISVANYIPEAWEDWDTGDEGEVIHTGGIDPNFEDTNFEEEFDNDSTVYGIPDLLDELVTLIEEKIATSERKLELMKPEQGTLEERKIFREIQKYKLILSSAKDWAVDEFCVTLE